MQVGSSRRWLTMSRCATVQEVIPPCMPPMKPARIVANPWLSRCGARTSLTKLSSVCPSTWTISVTEPGSVARSRGRAAHRARSFSRVGQDYSRPTSGRDAEHPACEAPSRRRLCQPPVRLRGGIDRATTTTASRARPGFSHGDLLDERRQHRDRIGVQPEFRLIEEDHRGSEGRRLEQQSCQRNEPQRADRQ